MVLLVVTAREVLESYGHENTYKKDEVWKTIKEKYEAKPGARIGNHASSLKNKYNNSYLEITKSANEVSDEERERWQHLLRKHARRVEERH